ncbi:CDP-glycerol glycerophosphotransferase family protein [Oceanimonas marisflavi]|uniref:CDP-glycerol glycerophosphotransferase family protein n=1 Tax=Oceanimonas marisflavi TaxID=2059724 RepID=UPI000D313CF6|nr:CDP-glycerol glycerophosphotransferase family protein [Oceanimonas marisflavi]
MKHKKIKKNRLGKLYNTIKLTIICEIARIGYLISKPFFKKDIWIIGETENQAQENGYFLFRWIRENHPEMDVYYVISSKSPSLKKPQELGNTLVLGTIKQVFFLYHANKIISTHGLWMIPDELGILKKITRKKLNFDGVMLNHGVGFLKNGSKYYHKKTFPLNNLIIALSPDHKKIFTTHYGYDDKDVIITGYPRFDDLVDFCEEKKTITFMPTYRDGEDNLEHDAFKSTSLYKATKRLMIDEKLLNSLEEKNIKLVIYLHQNIQKYSDSLDGFSSKNVSVAKQGRYTVQDLLKRSSLLITDYSSVFFDFVYMKKPFISYQFDYDEFISSRKEKAFIDFKKDIPGTVVSDHNSLIEKIIENINNEFTFSMKDEKKASRFFSFYDQKNCERVFEAIKSVREIVS